MIEARVKLKLDVHPALVRHNKTDDTYEATNDIALLAKVLDGTLTRMGYLSGRVRLALVAEMVNFLPDDDRRFVATCIISGQGFAFQEEGDALVPALQKRYETLANNPEDPIAPEVTAKLWVPGS